MAPKRNAKPCPGLIPALPGGQAMFKGVAASPGMAMGEAVVITPPADLNSVPDLIPSDQEYEIARLWRDARVMRIYGGTSEIMKDLISRSI